MALAQQMPLRVVVGLVVVVMETWLVTTCRELEPQDRDMMVVEM